MLNAMISVLIIAVVLLGTSNAESCPACKNDCGEDGYLTCQGCMCNPSCRNPNFCSEPKQCVLFQPMCFRQPCPKMPTCIDPQKVCDFSPALRDKAGSLVQCTGLLDSCPADYTCTSVPGAIFSICCKGNPKKTVQPSEEPPLPPPVDGIPPWLAVDASNETSEGPKIDTEDCRVCDRDPCEMGITCDRHPMARCVTDDCTCSSWFIDENEERVECLDEPQIPVNFDNLFPSDPFDVRTSTTPSKPAAVTSQQGQFSRAVVRNVIIASCVVFALVICLLIACKMVHTRRKNVFRKQQEEQLKPLQIANNNKMDIA